MFCQAAAEPNLALKVACRLLATVEPPLVLTSVPSDQRAGCMEQVRLPFGGDVQGIAAVRLDRDVDDRSVRVPELQRRGPLGVHDASHAEHLREVGAVADGIHGDRRRVDDRTSGLLADGGDLHLGEGSAIAIQGGDGETGIYGAADRVSDNPA